MAATTCPRRVGPRRRWAPGRDVGREHERPPTEGLHLAPRRFEAVAAAGHESDVGALAGKGADGGAAYTG
jgi:hypothetical protein